MSPEEAVEVLSPAPRVSATQSAAALGARLTRAKRGFSTRCVSLGRCAGLLADAVPSPGDLVLARIDSISQHSRLQLAAGRRAQLYPGDEVVLVYAHRYAPNQWEAVVPDSLEPCDLVAAGGLAGRVCSRNAASKRPTRLIPIGLLADGLGQPLNLRDDALPRATGLPAVNPPLIAVIGTQMDCGKTTTASALIRGLSLAGRRVVGLKLTGTGAGGDYWEMLDAGAVAVWDFMDAGHASTYQASREDLETIFATLMTQAAKVRADVVVAEIADGIYQAESAALIGSELFRRVLRRTIVAAADAAGATTVCQWLAERGLAVTCVSGRVSASTLGAHEVQAATGLPVQGIADLSSPVGSIDWLS